MQMGKKYGTFGTWFDAGRAYLSIRPGTQVNDIRMTIDHDRR
ncbi:hypothetical protein SAMN05216344_14310 [Polaromonas sp. OV174]|nr:hypothetical protein SAMN05216344_14310 [Polaromonas sp. OV174]